VAGECGIDRIASFDPSGFDTQIAGEVKDFNPVPAFPSRKRCAERDRLFAFGVYAAWQALKDSDWILEK